MEIDTWDPPNFLIVAMYKKLGIWMFLGYLVLFLNLGFSLHRVLRPKTSESAAHNQLVLSDCSCCHHSPPRDIESSFFADSDCSICKFFQTYQVTFCTPAVLFDWEANDHRTASLISVQISPRIATVARGPPTNHS